MSSERPDTILIGKTENSVELELFFREDYQFFDGHFSDFKLLPALIQIHLVTGFIGEFFNKTPSFRSIPSLKFVNPICPKEKVILKITIDLEKNRSSFIFSVGERKCSSGTLSL